MDGQPLGTATVTFLPISGQRTVAVGETDDEGVYRLTYLNASGASPGTYRVAISYKVTASGEPLGLAIQSSLAPSPKLGEAEELLPPRYSDLGRSELRAEVSEVGGTIDFALEGPLRSRSDPQEPAEPADVPEARPADAEPGEVGGVEASGVGSDAASR
ncbi:carboxypeptidase-like regulatory domain-containing protein [Tautonia sociabilis]|uniref:carboxypeptidase-like regulatory domain-containing protein n=1 Tax=Tautonia sociabilis TaxID=2080755 RepID=UPI000F8691F5|nr:carboxypeptidase-like regulatory domain-containing protein [Tautonia sociabilis]